MLEQGLETVFEWVDGENGKYYDMAIKICLLQIMIGLVSYARARVIVWWGDPTPAVAGQVTPDPRTHLSWFSTLLAAVFLYIFRGLWTLGSGKQVMRNNELLGNTGRLLVALSAPVASALLGLVTLGVMIALIPVMDLQMMDTTYKVLQIFAFFCLFHAVLHLVPIPPFDGAEVVRWLLPGERLKAVWDVFARWFSLLFLLVIIIFWVLVFTAAEGEMAQHAMKLQPVFERISDLFQWAIVTVDDFIDFTFLDCKARMQ